MFQNQKGQGSLEYLLMIGGAVLVAAIVIGLVVTSSSSAQSQTGVTTAASLCTSTQNVNGATTAENKTISGQVYWCCSDIAVSANGYYRGATTTVLTGATQLNAQAAVCTLAR